MAPSSSYSRRPPRESGSPRMAGAPSSYGGGVRNHSSGMGPPPRGDGYSRGRAAPLDRQRMSLGRPSMSMSSYRGMDSSRSDGGSMDGGLSIRTHRDMRRSHMGPPGSHMGLSPSPSPAASPRDDESTSRPPYSGHPPSSLLSKSFRESPRDPPPPQGPPPASRVSPRKPDLQKQQANAKKEELLRQIDAIDMEIFRTEKQQNLAEEEEAEILQKFLNDDNNKQTNEAKARSVALADHGAKKKEASTMDVADAKKKARRKVFVNKLESSKLPLSEIVKETLRQNRMRAFVSRANLTRFVDDGVLESPHELASAGSTVCRSGSDTTPMKPNRGIRVRGVPSLARVRGMHLSPDGSLWRDQDELAILPLYSSPQESPSWNEVKRVHEKIRSHVMEVVALKKSTTAKFTQNVAAKYHEHYQKWQERLSRSGAKTSSGSRDRRHRDRAATSLHQQLESRRDPSKQSTRDQDRQRWYADMLLAQEQYSNFDQGEGTQTSTLATIPKMIIGKRARLDAALRANNNSRILDPAAEEHKARLRNPWSDSEKVVFLAKFLEFPKEFWRIASYLKNKSTNDVIAFYYRVKKKVDLKALLKKQLMLRNAAKAKRKRLSVMSANIGQPVLDEEERFGEMQERLVTKKVNLEDNSGTTKTTVVERNQARLLEAPAWSILVDAARRLGVDVPIQRENAYENDPAPGHRYVRCYTLDSQLSDVSYSDWPEDHWSLHRTDPRTVGHYANSYACHNWNGYGDEETFANPANVPRKLVRAALSKGKDQCKRPPACQQTKWPPLSNYAHLRLIQASRGACFRAKEPNSIEKYLKHIDERFLTGKDSVCDANAPSSGGALDITKEIKLTESKEVSSEKTATEQKPTTKEKLSSKAKSSTKTRVKSKADRQQQKWTDEEKVIYLRCLRKYGKNWPKFEERIVNKTLAQIRNFYQNYKVKMKLLDILKEYEMKAAAKAEKKRKKKRGREGDVEESSKRSRKKRKKEKAQRKKAEANEARVEAKQRMKRKRNGGGGSDDTDVEGDSEDDESAAEESEGEVNRNSNEKKHSGQKHVKRPKSGIISVKKALTKKDSTTLPKGTPRADEAMEQVREAWKRS